MSSNRRNFLKTFGCAVLAAGSGFPLLEALASANESKHGAGAALSKQWGMIVDIKKCLNERVREACIEACHTIHNVPDIPDAEEEVKWIWSEKFNHTFPDQVHPHNSTAFKNMPVLNLCNHCTNPGCVKVCPTGATWKRKSDGIVMMDMHRCIGCRYCMAGCPYGVRSFNWRDPRPYIKNTTSPFPTRSIGVVEKCNFCAERLRDGLEPACVEAARKVPGGDEALVFGDISEPDSHISRILRDTNTIVRRVSSGTGPNVFYIV